MKRGWYRESVRHSLAAKGVRTNYLKGKKIFSRGLGDDYGDIMELQEKKKKRPQRGKKGLIRAQPARDIEIEGVLLEPGQSGLDLVRKKIEIAKQRQSAREIAAKAKKLKQRAEGEQLEQLEEIRAEYAKKSRESKKELKDLNRRIAALQNPRSGPATLGKQADRELQEFEREQRKSRMEREAEAREGAKKMPIPEPTERFGKPTRIKFRGRDTTGTVDTRDPEVAEEEELFGKPEKLQKIEVELMSEEEMAEERPKAKVPERVRIISGDQGAKARREKEKQAREEAREFKEELSYD